MNSAVFVTRSLGHLAARAQLLERGVAAADIVAAVRAGQLVRVRRGHYATPGAPAAARLAVRIGGRLAGVSASATYGLWSGDDARVHVAVPRNAARLRRDPADPRVVVHWIDTEPGGQCWRVGPRDAVRQTVSWADTETAVACLDTAMTTWGWTSGYLERLFADAAAAERFTVLRARVGSGSGVESLVRQRLELAGVAVEQQRRVGGVGFVDFVVRGVRLVIEVDGFEHHGTRRGFEEDRRRDAALAALGYAVLRFTYRHVTRDWDSCVATIRATIAQLRKT